MPNSDSVNRAMEELVKIKAADVHLGRIVAWHDRLISIADTLAIAYDRDIKARDEWIAELEKETADQQDDAETYTTLITNQREQTAKQVETFKTRVDALESLRRADARTQARMRERLDKYEDIDYLQKQTIKALEDDAEKYRKMKTLVMPDAARKELFKGTALDYVRMRAFHHKTTYCTKKNLRQAAHLLTLADEMEQELAEQVETIKALRKRGRYWRHISWLYRERLKWEEAKTAEQAETITRLRFDIESENEAYETAARLCDEKAQDLREWNKMNLARWASDQARAFEEMAREIRDYKSDAALDTKENE